MTDPGKGLFFEGMAGLEGFTEELSKFASVPACDCPSGNKLWVERLRSQCLDGYLQLRESSDGGVLPPLER